MHKHRILVVDDEPNLSELVRFALEKTQRFEVRVENRPSRAYLAAKEFRPDLVLLDVNMPGKDGGEVFREIEADPALREVPVLFLTSLITRAEAVDRETIRGGKRYLPKPVVLSTLISVIDRLLQQEAGVA